MLAMPALGFQLIAITLTVKVHALKFSRGHPFFMPFLGKTFLCRTAQKMISSSQLWQSVISKQ
jgi:hypothetical protein